MGGMLQSTLTHVAILGSILTLALACRERGNDGSSLRAEATATTAAGEPTDAFLKACKAFPTMPPSDPRYDVFGAGILSAFPNQTVSAQQLAATKPCPELWAALATKGELALWPTKDVGAVKMFVGLPIKSLKIILRDFPAKFDVVKQLAPSAELSLEIDPGYGAGTEGRAAILDLVRSLPATVRTLRLQNVGFNDLQAAEHLASLEALEIPMNGLSDLSFLEKLPSLRKLVAFQNQIRDLSPLSALLSLEYLSMESNDVDSLEPLMACANLETLYMRGNQKLADIFALQYLPNLKFLGVSGTPIKTIEPLAKLPLKSLAIDATLVDSIEPLRKTPLAELFIQGTKVKDLSPIEGMTQLSKLNAEGLAQITKLPAKLTGTKLAIVDLKGTEITDYCPLYRVPTMKVLRLKNGTQLNAFKIQSAGYDCPPN